MNTQDVHAHVASLDTHPSSRMAELDLAGAEADLLDAITTREALTDARPARRPARRRWIATAAVTCAVAGAAAFGLTRFGDTPQQAWSAEARAFAVRSQQMLIDGWTVTRADEYGDEGEMTFTRGARSADLHWRSATVAGLTRDRAASADLTRPATVDGVRATIFRYAAPRLDPPPGAGEAPPVTIPDPSAAVPGLRDFTAIWRRPGATMELRAQTASLDEFRAILAQVDQVPVDRWLAAMPASVIIPGQRPQAVDAMLRDMPVPSEVDVAALRDGTAVQDRYQLGAQVSATVACAWFTRLRAAEASGDNRAAGEARAALRSTRDWGILREMTAQGAFSSVLWELADVAQGRGAVSGGKAMSRTEALSPARLDQALGCGSRDG